MLIGDGAPLSRILLSLNESLRLKIISLLENSHKSLQKSNHFHFLVVWKTRLQKGAWLCFSETFFAALKRMKKDEREREREDEWEWESEWRERERDVEVERNKNWVLSRHCSLSFEEGSNCEQPGTPYHHRVTFNQLCFCETTQKPNYLRSDKNNFFQMIKNFVQTGKFSFLNQAAGGGIWRFSEKEKK